MNCDPFKVIHLFERKHSFHVDIFLQKSCEASFADSLLKRFLTLWQQMVKNMYTFYETSVLSLKNVFVPKSGPTGSQTLGAIQSLLPLAV